MAQGTERPVEAPTADESPATEAPAEAAGVPAAPSPPADLLRCDPRVRAVELGAAGDGWPSAPVLTADGVLVAFTRMAGEGSELLVQRIGLDGSMTPPVVVRSSVHGSRPALVGQGGTARVVATGSERVEVVALDPATGRPTDAAPVLLDHYPVGVALGPRGLVTVQAERTHYLAHREGQRPVRLPAPRSTPVPAERIVASGADADLLLIRRGRTARAVALTGERRTRSPVLFRDRDETWAEASVGAGPRGFALVRTGPAIGDLEVFLAGPSGAVGDAVAIPAPAPVTEGASIVRRYPRVAAVGDGWALSYWDGTGPTVVRIDGAGQVTGAPIAIRSGDERGGHTDARMAASERVLAVTWQVEPPRRSHGFPEEEPRRPGPRLALVTCAD